MQGLRADSPFARFMAASLGDEVFRLIDVGVAGGVGRSWQVFGERLRLLAVAGSPDGAAAAAAEWPEARHVVHSLDVRGAFAPTPWPTRYSRDRMVELRAGIDKGPLDTWVRQASAALPPQPSPTGAAPALRPEPGVLGQEIAALAEAEGFGAPDFLRLDAGAADYEILTGASALLSRPTLLGVCVRGRLFGSDDVRDNSFHNMDRLLRGHGFEIYEFHQLIYSAAALPAPFMAAHPDTALFGRPGAAVVIYMRDLSRPGAAQGLPAASIAKAAAMFSLMGVPDAAAEALVMHRQHLAAAGIDVDAGLDHLALQAQADYGATRSYADYISAFERQDPHFFNVFAAREAWMQGLVATAREAPKEIERLSSKVAGLVRRVHAAEMKANGPPKTAEALQADAVRRSELHPGHHWIFDHFDAYRGPAEAEFYYDYIGDRIRPKYESWGTPVALDHLESPLPEVSEEYFEWMDLAQATLEAGPVFTMLELGAGYGRWSSRGAHLARQLGKQPRLGLAEAEPKHQQWLREHLADNGVAPSEFETFDFAVSGEVGRVVFTVGVPGASHEETHFGHAVMPLDLEGRDPIGDYYGAPLYEAEGGWRCIIVDQKPLSVIIDRYDFIDIADFDLQGAEALAIAEALPQLTAKVRRLHIGTHGHDIEADLRRLLSGAGWICLRDFPCHGRHDTPFGPCDFVDGVQSWVNPALL